MKNQHELWAEDIIDNARALINDLSRERGREAERLSNACYSAIDRIQRALDDIADGKQEHVY